MVVPGDGPAGPPPRPSAWDEGTLRDAWERARAHAEPRGAALAEALHAVARAARAADVPVTTLLRALDRLSAGGDSSFCRVRTWAGTEVIRAYFQDR